MIPGYPVSALPETFVRQTRQDFPTTHLLNEKLRLVPTSPGGDSDTHLNVETVVPEHTLIVGTAAFYD